MLTELLMSTIAAQSLRVSSTGACFGVFWRHSCGLALAELVVADRLRGAPAGVHESLSGLRTRSPGGEPDRHRKEQRLPVVLFIVMSPRSRRQ